MNPRPLQGKVFCFTGKLEKPRKMYAEFVEALGGEFSEKMTSRTNVVVCSLFGDETEKIRKAEELGILMVSDITLFAMAGMTLEEFQKRKREWRIAEKIAYENSYQGKLDRLRASATAFIAKIGDAMVIPSENTRIYIHYTIKERKHAALVKCISKHGVAYTDRNGKSCFQKWDTIASVQLMEVADYLEKYRDIDKRSFRSRLRALNKEAEKLGQLPELLSAS